MVGGGTKGAMGRITTKVIVLLALAVMLVFGLAFLRGVMTLEKLLAENKLLKEAIARLTTEEQIGYAKVMKQERVDGRLMTTLLFVETDRDNPTRRVLERQYTIEGDIIHFDALIVKFDNSYVQDGRERALYLWRRVYGETMRPMDGLPIEAPGSTPERYHDLAAKLSLNEQTMFWDAIWSLSNDPEALRAHGIQAVSGGVVYKKLRPGLIYMFKMGNAGQFVMETVPEL